MDEFLNKIDTFAQTYFGAGTLLIMLGILFIASVVFVLTDNTPLAWKDNHDGTTTLYYIGHKETVININKED